MRDTYFSFFILLLLSIQGSFAQQMPIDFSDTNDDFIGFSGSSFAFNLDPTDGNNAVGQFFNDGSTTSQGFFLDLSRVVDLEVQKTISLSFYAFDPNMHKIVLKLENGTNPDVEVETTRPGISPADWTTVTFDFSNAKLSSNGSTINAEGIYSRVTIFIDIDDNSSGTYLIDDIDDDSEPENPNELDVIYTDLVWFDEFDGANGAIDSNNWFHQTQFPQGNSWFNGELQHYTNRIENSFIEDGFLNIVAIRENFRDQGVTTQFTSARLNSKFAFTYGRVDVRAKLPFGNGTWPAIWTLGRNINENGAYWDNQGFGTTNWPATGEIDIMEHGLHAVNEVSSALHTPSSFGNTVNTRTQVLADVANEFHVYSLNWSPDQISFLIDDEIYYTYNPAVQDANTWPFDLDQYILLNVAMGGFAGAVDSSFDRSAMLIDYVRVFQNNTLSTEEVGISDFEVYPNPANSIINITSNKIIDKVELYSILGQQILLKTRNVTEFNVSNFQA